MLAQGAARSVIAKTLERTVAAVEGRLNVIRWRAVPEDRRSPAPAWWWQPAYELRELTEVMSPIWCHHLELPIGSTCATGAAVLMATLADQTSLPWPDEFPFKVERHEPS